ncbi:MULTISPECIES: NADH-quinone oxidoreductase subunit M [Nitratiruptor]|uniref:NADH dehydrogenase subunit M n=1 Tax=Nitratiruptor tergarcus DSM 16512 TaxID=1069081 RepID=A0A1W1WS10_9BACT|nr:MULTISPECIES: NADH-quinone oxidoreductase subunit M [Nitratiruptor]BCD61496.1 NADH-quinone oxidoreductase subunit M [Nitratiruptor sp. YY08-13]BCD65430.1 NADH-quinone oxidoreductase subunit M [Nitratiruptor sp. YY08-26]SMC08995.1 NADH dehydrogenase subunit M [Nitratiruptor tergarcus DSM 16512]
MDHILSLLIFFPALAGMLGFVVKRDNIKVYGITVAAIEFLLSLVLWLSFDYSNGGFQFAESIPLVPDYGINYQLGVDGISLFLIVLSTFITLVGLISLTIEKNLKNLIISLLFLEMTMVGVFVALDAVVFYVFWELSLVPMLYIIGYWGSELRVYAAIKFFLYTFFGSLIMLVGMLFMAYLYYLATGTISFSIPEWHRLILPYNYQIWLFLAFFLGMAIKVPMFPFHTWLPYAHGQAPTIGSVILAAVLLKMGTYGFVRFSLPLFPDASVALIPVVAFLAIVMVIYTAMVAYAQEDMKQVIAYSSISHMGVIVLGTFAMNVEGIAGSIFLMISHGIVSGALFMLVGNIYDRRHTKLLTEFGGLASVMPKYATIFGIVLMASVGLPLTIGFVGEFLSLMGVYKISTAYALLGGTGIILGAAYMLRLYKMAFFGPLTNEKNRNLPDLNWKELTSLVSLVVVIVWLGVNPNPVLKPINKSVENMLQLMEKKAITKEAKDILSHNKVELEAK